MSLWLLSLWFLTDRTAWEHLPGDQGSVLLQAAGAEAIRLEVYQTAPGSHPEACQPERQLLLNGSIHAIAFSSTAEVCFRLCLYVCNVLASACQSVPVALCTVLVF